jgi:hypothetical protein
MCIIQFSAEQHHRTWRPDMMACAGCAGGGHGAHLHRARAPQRATPYRVSKAARSATHHASECRDPKLNRCTTCRLNLLTAVGAAVLAASTWRFGAGHTALGGILLATAVLSVLLHDMPTDNAGHRAGGHGYGSLRPQVPVTPHSTVTCSTSDHCVCCTGSRLPAR